MGRRHLTVIVAFCTVLTIGTGPRPTTADAASAVTVTGTTPGQAVILDWALALYAAAGLELPGVDIVGHDSSDACMGRNGMHTMSNGRSTIHICTREAGPFEEFLFLHELAHAWERANVTGAQRVAFLDQRGLTEWTNDGTNDWHERGAEHAAEIIAWGLIDRPTGIVRIPDTSCAQLVAGYVSLVGRPPLHGYEDVCRSAA